MKETEPDIFYTDAMGFRNRECLSLGCDTLPLFQGRSPVQMYGDFIEAFADKFADMLGELLAFGPSPFGSAPSEELPIISTSCPCCTDCQAELHTHKFAVLFFMLCLGLV